MCVCVFSSNCVLVFARVDNEHSRMAADTARKTQELQQFCVELTKYLEAWKVAKEVQTCVHVFVGWFILHSINGLVWKTQES